MCMQSNGQLQRTLQSYKDQLRALLQTLTSHKLYNTTSLQQLLCSLPQIAGTVTSVLHVEAMKYLIALTTQLFPFKVLDSLIYEDSRDKKWPCLLHI